MKIENLMKIRKLKIENSTRGFSLFIAIIIMAALLLASFAIANISAKQISFATSNRESERAYFAAEAGSECAIYWDNKGANQVSPFDTGAMASFVQVYLNEFSGIDTVSPLDQASSNYGFASGPPGEVIDSGSKTTTSANELIFGHGEEFNTGPVETGAGFTNITTYNENNEEFKTVSSTGSYNTSFTLDHNGGGDGDWVAFMATFKASVGNTPAPVQHNEGQSGLTTRSLTFNNPSTNGDIILAQFSYNSSDFVISSVTDTNGNSYTRIGPVVTWSLFPFRSELWYAKNITGGGAPITVSANSPAFVPQDIDCNGQHITGGLSGTNDVTGTQPAQPHRIGGGGLANPTSIFQLNFSDNTCTIVSVTKNIDGTTNIQSRGYNTCNTSDTRRVERGVEVNY